MTTYTSVSAITDNQVIVDAGRRFCPYVLRNIVGAQLSQSVASANPGDLYAYFYTRFQLPVGFTTPLLRLSFSVDDYVKIELNGKRLGLFAGFGKVHTLVVNHSEVFKVGTIVIKFHVTNNPFKKFLE